MVTPPPEGCVVNVGGKWKTKLTAKPVNRARSAATATRPATSHTTNQIQLIGIPMNAQGIKKIIVKGGNAGSDMQSLARGLAMHIAAMNPPYISPKHVPADFVAREKEIALAQVKDSGKPAEILEKMIAGKVAKTVSEITLTGQPYVLDTNITVEAALKAAGGAEVLNFVRLAVGEGIEKQTDDFAAEVMKQAGLA